MRVENYIFVYGRMTMTVKCFIEHKIEKDAHS